MKKHFLVLTLVLFAAQITSAMAQDLHKSYTVGAGGYVRINNISGDIRITGYNGSAITVDATVEGPDRQLVTIEDLSTAGGVELGVKYPERGNTNARVEFQVLVPALVEYDFDRINSVSGNIDVTGVRGKLRLNSVSGRITAKDLTGIVSANAVSGNVDVEITRLEGRGDMKFAAVSGNVNVVAPNTLAANIEMSTLSGALETTFPIPVEEKTYGPGRSARGVVGGRADFSLRLTTISGKVSLTGK